MEEKNDKVVSFPVELPSAGLLYEDESLKKGVLHVKPMTVAEEELLGAQKESDKIMVLDSIIKRCLIEKIPYDKLLVTDKLFLLFAIRRCSYGDDYRMKVKCDECSFQFMHAVEFFDSFKIRVLSENDGTEPFSVTLPSAKSVVTFRLLRVSDEDEIFKYGRRLLQRNKKGIGDPTYSFRLGMHIVSVDGQTDLDLDKKLAFVRSLVGSDSAALKDAIEQKQSGVNIDIKIECPGCGADLEKFLQFTPEFFRPGNPESDT